MSAVLVGGLVLKATFIGLIFFAGMWAEHYRTGPRDKTGRRRPF